MKNGQGVLRLLLIIRVNMVDKLSYLGFVKPIEKDNMTFFVRGEKFVMNINFLYGSENGFDVAIHCFSRKSHLNWLL